MHRCWFSRQHSRDDQWQYSMAPPKSLMNQHWTWGIPILPETSGHSHCPVSWSFTFTSGILNMQTHMPEHSGTQIFKWPPPPPTAPLWDWWELCLPKLALSYHCYKAAQGSSSMSWTPTEPNLSSRNAQRSCQGSCWSGTCAWRAHFGVIFHHPC